MVKIVFKEIFIMIGLLIAIVLILGILFYKYVPTSKVVPIAAKYQQEETITNELKDVVKPEDLKTIVTYTVDASDLKYYEKHKDYVKGKQDPFEDYLLPSNNTVAGGNTTNGGTTNGGTTGGADTNNVNGGTLNPNENK